MSTCILLCAQWLVQGPAHSRRLMKGTQPKCCLQPGPSFHQGTRREELARDDSPPQTPWGDKTVPPPPPPNLHQSAYICIFLLGFVGNLPAFPFPNRFLRRMQQRREGRRNTVSSAPFWQRRRVFSSVPQSRRTLCDPMNRSTPGLPVHHQLPEFTQTHVH